MSHSSTTSIEVIGGTAKKENTSTNDCSGTRTPLSDLNRALKFWDGAEKRQVGGVDITSKAIDYYETGTRDNNHLKKLYALGDGWSFDFPSIEYASKDETGTSQNLEVLHVGDGRSFQIGGTSTKPDIERYPVMDMEIEKNGGAYTLFFKDGKKSIFNTNRQLIRQEDRFGNKITFAYASDGRLSIITNSMGRVLELKVNGSIMQWVRKDNNEILYTYTVSSQKLMAASDQAGRKTSFAYVEQVALNIAGQSLNEKGSNFTYVNLTKVIHPTGAETHYTYAQYTEDNSPYTKDPEDRLECYRRYYMVTSREDVADPKNKPNEASNTATYAYSRAYKNSNGSLTTGSVGKYLYQVTHTAPSGLKTVHTFDEKGLRIKEKVNSGNTAIRESEFTYDNTTKLMTKEIVKSAGSGGGSLTKTSQWTYSADKKGNITKLTVNNDGNANILQEQTYTYDSKFNLVTQSSKRVNSGLAMVEKYTLDSSNKVVEWKKVYEKTAAKETLKEQIKYEYDAKFRVTKEHHYYGDLAGAKQFYTTTFTYDDSGVSKFSPDPIRKEISGIKNPDGSAAASIYGAGIFRESFEYDWYGRKVKVTDGRGNATDYVYDKLGRCTKETYPSVDGKRYTKSFAFSDTANHITETNESGISRRYDYTPLGDISTVTILSPDTKLLSFTYDNCCRKTKEISYALGGAVKLTVSYAYDAQNRITFRTATGTGVSASESYAFTDGYQNRYNRTTQTMDGDANAPSVSIITDYDACGNICRLQTAKGAIVSEYDSFGNCVKQTDPLGKVTTWTHDYAGRVISQRTPLGQTESFTYDALGNLISQTDVASNTTIFAYDALGRLVEKTVPFDDKASAKTRHWYDMSANIIRTDILRAGSVWTKTRYEYDTLGRMTKIILTEDDGTETATLNQYDAVGNRTALYIGVKGSDLQNANKTSYEYDRFGNLMKMTDSMGGFESFKYDATGQLLEKINRNGSIVKNTYDALGRLTGETISGGDTSAVTRSLSYTKTGRKMKESSGVSSLEFHYDNAGLLIRQVEYGGVKKSIHTIMLETRTHFPCFLMASIPSPFGTPMTMGIE